MSCLGSVIGEACSPVDSPRVIVCGKAVATWIAIGRYAPSVIANDLGALLWLVFPTLALLIAAPTQVPSMNHSLKSNPWRSARSVASYGGMEDSIAHLPVPTAGSGGHMSDVTVAIRDIRPWVTRPQAPHHAHPVPHALSADNHQRGAVGSELTD